MVPKQFGAAAAALVLAMACLCSGGMGAALGCPVIELARKVSEPLQAFKKVEVAAQEAQSTDGGVWHVYLTPNGRVHSIVRTDYGETGRWQSRASFLDSKNFGIETVEERYAEPYYAKQPLKIVSRSTVAYFFCEADGVIYMPVKSADDGNAGAPFLKAKAERAVFFKAGEIAPYLKLLGAAAPKASAI